MAHHIIGHFLGGVLRRTPGRPLPRLLNDADFVAAVLFVERRYLYGQAVLSRCVVEDYGRSFFMKADTVSGD
eukprot:8089245-Prorocentrum_lima.AAC.1